MYGVAPAYLCQLVSIKQEPKYNLKSSAELYSHPAKTKKTLGDRAFQVAAPTLWNNLSVNIRDVATRVEISIFVPLFLFFFFCFVFVVKGYYFLGRFKCKLVFSPYYVIVYCLARDLVKFILLVQNSVYKRCSCLVLVSRCQFRSAVQIL